MKGYEYDTIIYDKLMGLNLEETQKRQLSEWVETVSLYIYIYM
jgi:hypothetical protein